MYSLNDIERKWRFLIYIIVAVILVILVGVPTSLRFKVKFF